VKGPSLLFLSTAGSSNLKPEQIRKVGAALVRHDHAGVGPPRAGGRDLVLPLDSFASRP